jgi:hypothetical protein
LSKRRILDKSKTDAVTKVITILQTLWFATQVIGRASQHLPISTLEIFTVSIVISSFLSFILWWHKPKDVSTQTTLRIEITRDQLYGIIRLLEDQVQIMARFLGAKGFISLFLIFISILAIFCVLFSAGAPLLA